MSFLNRREIARTRLEAIAGAYSSNSILALFGRGHLAIKAGGAIYITRCAPVEIQKLPRGNTCPDEKDKNICRPYQLCHNLSRVT
jgi:hypothetical protein